MPPTQGGVAPTGVDVPIRPKRRATGSGALGEYLPPGVRCPRRYGRIMHRKEFPPPPPAALRRSAALAVVRIVDGPLSGRCQAPARQVRCFFPPALYPGSKGLFAQSLGSSA